MDLPYLFAFCPDVTIPRRGQRSKDIVQNIFGQRVFRREEFMILDEDTGRVGQLGSCSIRKFSAMFLMRRCGCTKDKVNIRGRWKGKGRTYDVYADVELPYPDAKVAEKLSLGGPSYYAFDTTVCNDVAMMNQFILSHIVPNVRRRLLEAASLVLGIAVLWLIDSSYDANKFALPDHFLQQVRGEWQHIQGGGDENHLNPVKNVPIQINRTQGVVFIDEISKIPLLGGAGVGCDGRFDGIRVVHGGRGNALESIQNQLLALQGSVMLVQSDNHDLQSEIGAVRLVMDRGFAIVNGNIQRIVIVPGHCCVEGLQVGGSGDNLAHNCMIAA